MLKVPNIAKLFVIAVPIFFTSGATLKVYAQEGCSAVLPKFAAAMKAGTPEALSGYLADHAPCFEAPVKAKLKALGVEPELATPASAAPAAAPEPAPAAPAKPVPAAPQKQESKRKAPPVGGCAAVLPKFAAAMKDGSAEALSTYLAQNAPCFEAPVKAKLKTLEGALKAEEKAPIVAEPKAVEEKPAPAVAPVDAEQKDESGNGEDKIEAVEAKSNSEPVEEPGTDDIEKEGAAKTETKDDSLDLDFLDSLVEEKPKDDAGKAKAKDDELDLDFLDSLTTNEPKDTTAKAKTTDDPDILEDLDDLLKAEPTEEASKPEVKEEVVDIKPEAAPVDESSCAKHADIVSERGLDALFFQIVNKGKKKLIVNWIDYEGKRKDPANLVPAGTFGGQSFIGYAFEVTTTDNTCVEIIVPTANQFEYIVGK